MFSLHHQLASLVEPAFEPFCFIYVLLEMFVVILIGTKMLDVALLPKAAAGKRKICFTLNWKLLAYQFLILSFFQ